MLALLALAACAPNVYRADIGAMFIRGEGALALQNAGGSLVLANAQNDFDRDLGLGDMEASPYVRLEWEHDVHRVRAHGFGVESSGIRNLGADFGSIVAGTAVNAEMNLVAAGLSYAYEVAAGRDYRVSLGGQLAYYGLDVAANSGTVTEAVETELAIPMPYAEVEYRLGSLILGLNGSFMAGDFSDANGRYLDFEGLVRWRPSRRFELLAGYRGIVLDAFGRASTRDFDADLDFDGFFIGGGVRF